MKVNVTGVQGLIAHEIKEAAIFYGRVLLHARTFKNITLDIQVLPTLQDAGDCGINEHCKSPRDFTIRLRSGVEDEDPVRTLAHEMVHLKQYATNKLAKTIVVTKGFRAVVENTWEGKTWKPKRGEDPYFDSPWEIEAYGREVGLYDRWVRMYNLMNFGSEG